MATRTSNVIKFPQPINPSWERVQLARSDVGERQRRVLTGQPRGQRYGVVPVGAAVDSYTHVLEHRSLLLYA